MLEDNAALQDDIVDTSDEDMEKLEKNLRMLGILGFVTALLSFVCVIGPGALLAIGIGVWAMRQARWSRAVHDGRDGRVVPGRERERVARRLQRREGELSDRGLHIIARAKFGHPLEGVGADSDSERAQARGYLIPSDGSSEHTLALYAPRIRRRSR